jgi:hypothetical protein
MKDTRIKLYYPESQIVKNLFTKGGEFMLLSNFDPYVGFYHRYATGEVFTEHEWNPLNSERLIRFKKFPETVKTYYDIKHFTSIGNSRRKNTSNSDEYYKYRAPRPSRRKLTDLEIKEGKTFRYFVNKRNERERVFFEITPDQVAGYPMLSQGINQFLYELLSLPWKVDGPEYDIYEDGILKIPGVIDTNLRIIDRYSQKFRILAQIVKNPRELTVYE